MFICSTKQDVIDALQGRTIRSVEFGDWSGVGGDREGDTRSIALHLSEGRSVVISATSYGTLQLEDHR